MEGWIERVTKGVSRRKLTHKRLTGSWKRSQDFKESLEILVKIIGPWSGEEKRNGRRAKSIEIYLGCQAALAALASCT